jgi:MFS family permease
VIARFALYGFLKNQRYFDAFLILAFLEKGLDFFQIGLLVAARELTVNVCELPSGAIADVYGRRRSMVLSFLAYIASFAVFGFAARLDVLVGAMVLFGVGEAFRSGTHKAMIFTWLRREGREGERVRVYGYTRSWSKIGSALSVVIAAVIVLATDRYAGVFLLSIVPYVANVVNLATYPRELDLDAERRAGGVMGHLRSAVRDAVGRRPLRRLLLEAMGFDGVFTATKDYLQPVLEAAAVATITAAALGGLSDTRRTAILVAPVYAALFLLAGAASRQAHRIPEAAGGEDRAAHVLWIALAVVFAAIGGAAYLDLVAVMIVAFVALHVVHNL